MTHHLAGMWVPDPGFVRYGGSRLSFRGPQRDTGARFIAVIGGAAAFGRHVEMPYPDLVEQRLAVPVVNLALPQAGIDAYLGDADVMELLARADAVVIHLMGAAALSNRFYTVHPRRNDRFVSASGAMRHLFPEVDFTEFAFVRHMMASLVRRAPDRALRVVEELRATWRDRMAQLLGQCHGRSVLVQADACDHLDEAMMAWAAARATALVRIVLSPADCGQGTRPDLPPGLPAQGGHDRIAQDLTAVLSRLLA
jgi:hypothetical protein